MQSSEENPNEELKRKIYAFLLISYVQHNKSKHCLEIVPQSVQVPAPGSLQSHYRQGTKMRHLDTTMARAMAQIL
ncbi:unnamed protein product [Caretta caretta]